MEPWVALLAEGVDRNGLPRIGRQQAHKSPSSRRAWIEIATARCVRPRLSVALLAEGVDRNLCRVLSSRGQSVALLAEGVDRNWEYLEYCGQKEVALLAEGVDRNHFCLLLDC